LAHQLRFHFGHAGLARIRAAGLTRYVEFWCQRNCRGAWQVVETAFTLTVSFASERDMVLFHLSEEYARFALSNGILQTPQPGCGPVLNNRAC
jgi:hypothetical protein